MYTVAGSHLVIRCQVKDGEKKSISQQSKDRLIIVGTSKLHLPSLASFCTAESCSACKGAALCLSLEWGSLMQ